MRALSVALLLPQVKASSRIAVLLAKPHLPMCMPIEHNECDASVAVRHDMELERGRITKT